jgi:hypothetical protein
MVNNASVFCVMLLYSNLWISRVETVTDKSQFRLTLELPTEVQRQAENLVERLDYKDVN